jgi:hypothetical protein
VTPCYHGVCTDLIADFSCDCTGTGFSGKRCQTNIDDCPSGACSSGGTCIDAVNDYSCNCTAGYDGTGTKTCTNHNDCPANACTPGGSCVDGLQSYSCNCTVAGYMSNGTACVDINDCNPNPCANGGRCSDLLNDFTCDCSNTGHVGKRCDMLSSGCAAAGTTCTVGVGACANTGVWVCDMATGTTLSCSATPGSSGTEVCDGIDNNCDGNIDELPLPTCTTTDNLATCTGRRIVNTSCAASNLTCYQAACTGSCAAGTYQCTSRTQSQKCDGTGHWNNDATCSSTANPPLVCDGFSAVASATYGTCIDNTPVNLGHDAVSGTLTRNGNTDDLLATPIFVPNTVTLVQLGVVTTSTSVGGLVILALYSDKVDGSGKHLPDARLAATTSYTLAAGSQNLRSVGSIQLTANTIYWAAVKLSEGTSENVVFARFSAATLNGWSTQYVVATDPWGTAPANPYPTGLSNTGELGIFLRVQK